MIEWDDKKRLANLQKHGVDFASIRQCDCDRALVIADERNDYGEARFVAFVLLGARLHVVVYTRRGERRRLISARKANSREVRFYETEVDRPY
jgi:uncharacterized protein